MGQVTREEREIIIYHIEQLMGSPKDGYATKKVLEANIRACRPVSLIAYFEDFAVDRLGCYQVCAHSVMAPCLYDYAVRLADAVIDETRGIPQARDICDVEVVVA